MDKIIVRSVYGKNRDEKDIQIGHKLELKFKLNIVGDELVWNDINNKKKGYEIKKGKSNLQITDKSITMKLGRKGSKKKA